MSKIIKLVYILNIETATKNCSVSVALNGNTIALSEFNDGEYSHSEKLHPLIEGVIQKAKIQLSDITAIGVSMGPGSYTGLRIGVSAAKGLCFALEKPLIAVNTLEILAHAISITKGFKIPLIDARRMEVYSAIYNSSNRLIRKVEAEIITETSFFDFLNSHEVYFLGDGAEKCKKIITHKNAYFIADKFPSSKEMALLSYQKYQQNKFENVAYFEPFYLKDFMVSKPKNT